MGSSNPNGQTIFNWQKDIVKEMIDLNSPKPTQSRGTSIKPFPSIIYGVTVYGDKPANVVNIGEMSDTKRLSMFVGQLSWPGQGNSFEDGLVKAQELFDNSVNSNPRKVLVLFVNDRSDVEPSTLKQLVQRLTRKGIELRIIAIGKRVDDSQIDVLTDGSDDVIVPVSGTERPADVAERLRRASEKGQ